MRWLEAFIHKIREYLAVARVVPVGVVVTLAFEDVVDVLVSMRIKGQVSSFESAKPGFAISDVPVPIGGLFVRLDCGAVHESGARVRALGGLVQSV